ncbi:hypothetical protein [Arthrobacter sp. Soil761]|uniref:hypothetical protein n=1 Tax=Arthrobacter sp. Soil761 TaxID=1736400 RepID=UPI0012E3607B|nr:hypothetical protein [Arthrobacter sp. Soil761]
MKDIVGRSGTGPHKRPVSEGSRRGDIGLFGIRNGVVWIADDVFVTRSADDVLVERWTSSRIITIAVRREATGTMQLVWAQLNDMAA